MAVCAVLFLASTALIAIVGFVNGGIVLGGLFIIEEVDSYFFDVDTADAVFGTVFGATIYIIYSYISGYTLWVYLLE